MCVCDKSFKMHYFHAFFFLPVIAKAGLKIHLIVIKAVPITSPLCEGLKSIGPLTLVPEEGYFVKRYRDYYIRISNKLCEINIGFKSGPGMRTNLSNLPSFVNTIHHWIYDTTKKTLGKVNFKVHTVNATCKHKLDTNYQLEAFFEHLDYVKIFGVTRDVSKQCKFSVFNWNDSKKEIIFDHGHIKFTSDKTDDYFALFKSVYNYMENWRKEECNSTEQLKLIKEAQEKRKQEKKEAEKKREKYGKSKILAKYYPQLCG